MDTSKYTPSVVARFWSKVDKTSNPNGCWIWTAGKSRLNGYGQFFVAGRNHSSHRSAYEIQYGPIPDGLLVLHRCDTPACVNPVHLFLGTQQDNMTDMVQKGRSLSGDKSPARIHRHLMPRGNKHGMRLHPERAARGESNGNVVITEDMVKEIRALYKTGKFSQWQIGERFGIHQGTVW
jgi:hypothetical protein